MTLQDIRRHFEKPVVDVCQSLGITYRPANTLEPNGDAYSEFIEARLQFGAMTGDVARGRHGDERDAREYETKEDIDKDFIRRSLATHEAYSVLARVCIGHSIGRRPVENPVAHLAEHMAENHGVAGSSPAWKPHGRGRKASGFDSPPSATRLS